MKITAIIFCTPDVELKSDLDVQKAASEVTVRFAEALSCSLRCDRVYSKFFMIWSHFNVQHKSHLDVQKIPASSASLLLHKSSSLAAALVMTKFITQLFMNLVTL